MKSDDYAPQHDPFASSGSCVRRNRQFRRGLRLV